MRVFCAQWDNTTKGRPRPFGAARWVSCCDVSGESCALAIRTNQNELVATPDGGTSLLVNWGRRSGIPIKFGKVCVDHTDGPSDSRSKSCAPPPLIFLHGIWCPNELDPSLTLSLSSPCASVYILPYFHFCPCLHHEQKAEEIHVAMQEAK